MSARDVIEQDVIDQFMEEHPAGTQPGSKKSAGSRKGKINESDNALQEYLETHGMEVLSKKRDAKGRTAFKVPCPFNPEHRDSAAVFRAPSSTLPRFWL